MTLLDARDGARQTPPQGAATHPDVAAGTVLPATGVITTGLLAAGPFWARLVTVPQAALGISTLRVTPPSPMEVPGARA